MVAGSAVFFVSAMLHEVIASVGLKQLDGRMTVFFGIHGLATLVFTAWSHRWPNPLPRPLAIGLHFLWMMLTVHWFIDPMDGFIHVSKWNLENTLQFLFPWV